MREGRLEDLDGVIRWVVRSRGVFVAQNVHFVPLFAPQTPILPLPDGRGLRDSPHKEVYQKLKNIVEKNISNNHQKNGKKHKNKSQ